LVHFAGDLIPTIRLRIVGIRLSPQTLERLEKLAEQAHASPMQVAALLLERAVQTVVTQESTGT
jgi:hypothetical protein